MKAAIYCRISTLLKGQDIDNQRKPLHEFAKGRGFEVVSEYIDEGISGATERRKGLDALVADAKRGKFKVILVMEISRIARDVRHLLNLLHELQAIGVSVCSVREGIDYSTPMGKAMLSMIGILMQVERELLAERIKTALAVKKLTAEQTGSGWKAGRPSKMNPELELEVMALKNAGNSIRQIARRLSISKTTVLRVVQKREK